MIYVSRETDIFFNLAYESVLISKCPNEKILYLWQNDRSVIIGRYQNPWQECNLERMNEDGVKLARRKSGGGAVFHDLGNVCFTVISPREHFSKEENYLLLTKTLNNLGINAEISGRNDILVNGKKVSGSAFEITKTAACHHGTMLLNSDLANIEKYLTPDKHKLDSHGVKSVSSRVCNLGITAQDFCSEIIKLFEPEAHITEIDKSLCEKDDLLKTQYDFFKSDSWRFGNTPTFTYRVETKFYGDSYTLLLDVKKGIVIDVTIYTDSLDTEKVEAVKNSIIGTEYQKLSFDDSSS